MNREKLREIKMESRKHGKSLEMLIDFIKTIKNKKTAIIHSKDYVVMDRESYNKLTTYSEEHCKICGDKVDEMKYKFPKTDYLLCHTCYGKIYDEIGVQLKRDREKVMRVIDEWEQEIPLSPYDEKWYMIDDKIIAELKQKLKEVYNGKN